MNCLKILDNERAVKNFMRFLNHIFIAIVAGCVDSLTQFMNRSANFSYERLTNF